MASRTKSFVLNRKSDWQENSVITNLTFNGENLSSNDENSDSGIYISSSFDSLENETVWHRLRLCADIPQNVLVKLRIYTSDSLSAEVPAFGSDVTNEVNLDDVFKNPNVSSRDKLDLFDYLGAKSFDNPDDLVLFEFKGRYLWFSLEVINYTDEVAVIKNIKIEFPRVSFIDYLPDVYRADLKMDSFLARFIAVFQSLYVDLDDNIDNMPSMFDPKNVDSDFLNWLAEWFSIDDGFIWGEERLRLLIENAAKIYKIKGTKESIRKIIEIYTGYPPIIVEHFDVTDNEYFEKSGEHIKKLYGDDIYTFSVIIKTDEKVTSDMYVEIMRIINCIKPADTICNVVILNKEIYLDHHCYLGINSYAASNEHIVLSDNSGDAGSIYLTDSGNS